MAPRRVLYWSLLCADRVADSDSSNFAKCLLSYSPVHDSGEGGSALSICASAGFNSAPSASSISASWEEIVSRFTDPLKLSWVQTPNIDGAASLLASGFTACVERFACPLTLTVAPHVLSAEQRSSLDIGVLSTDVPDSYPGAPTSPGGSLPSTL
jgi:hypothetical protein